MEAPASQPMKHRRPHGLQKRRGAYLAAFLWVLVIWGHSLMAGNASSAESGMVVMLVKPLLEACGVHEAAMQSFIVRKCGHFTEYLVLGLLSVHAWRPDWHRCTGHLASLVLFIVAVPFIDETIQRFVPGRQSALRDVLIDLAGSALGLLIASLVQRRKKGKDSPAAAHMRA